MNTEDTALDKQEITMKKFLMEKDESSMKMLIDTPSYPPITVTFTNITLNRVLSRFPTKKTKTLMEGISGYALPGQILCIMGTKRTGKSQLLSILAHIQKADDHFERIKINGKPINKAFYFLSSYIPTENEFVPRFTIRETLLYSCMLRLPRQYSIRTRISVVDCLLRQVNLYDIRNQSIDTLKREERKLLALALEIAKNPSILILDDPTVNLDFATTLTILRLLKRLANAGKTIIITSLYPKAFEIEYFDTILLLYKNEKGVANQAYFGKAEGIENYLALHHKFISLSDPWFPSLQEYIDARKQHLKTIQEKYDEEMKPIVLQQIKEMEVSTQFTFPYSQFDYYAAHWWLRFSVLFLRHLIGTNRNVTYFWVRVIQIVSLLLLISLTFWRLGNTQESDLSKRISALYFMVISLSFVGIFTSMFTFIEDTNAMMRERFSKLYGVGSFFLGKVVAEFFSFLPFVLFFAVLIYWIVGLYPSPDRFFIFLLTVICFVFAAQSLGELLASWAPVYALSQALLPLGTSLFSIYSNVTTPIASLPIYISWLYWISHFHYALEALLLNEFQGQVFWIQNNNGTTNSVTGEEVLRQRSIGSFNTILDTRWGCILMLIAIGVAFRWLAYMGLRYVKKPKRVLVSRMEQLEQFCEKW